MISKKFFEDIHLVMDDKSLTKEQVFESFEEALAAGCKKSHNVRTCRVELKEDRNEILIFTQHLVVDEYSLEENPDYTQMLARDANKINKRVKHGDILEQEITPKDFGLYAVNSFKNRLNEMLVSFQKDNLFQHFKKYENEMITARITDIADEFYRLDLGNDMTTILPKKEALPNDDFSIGQLTKVYITSVEMRTKWPKIFVSRSHDDLIKRILEDTIPELKDGTVEVMKVAREAGDRSKIGLKSNDPKVDPIGAVVGEGGSRIREVVKSLSGEKIDLFRWSDNERELIANSLQPAEVIAVTSVDADKKSAIAIVPNDQLSLAIGKLGQNVKLAVQATGWSIDIKSEEDAKRLGIEY